MGAKICSHDKACSVSQSAANRKPAGRPPSAGSDETLPLTLSSRSTGTSIATDHGPMYLRIDNHPAGPGDLRRDQNLLAPPPPLHHHFFTHGFDPTKQGKYSWNSQQYPVQGSRNLPDSQDSSVFSALQDVPLGVQLSRRGGFAPSLLDIYANHASTADSVDPSLERPARHDFEGTSTASETPLLRRSGWSAPAMPDETEFLSLNAGWRRSAFASALGSIQIPEKDVIFPVGHGPSRRSSREYDIDPTEPAHLFSICIRNRSVARLEVSFIYISDEKQITKSEVVVSELTKTSLEILCRKVCEARFDTGLECVSFGIAEHFPQLSSSEMLNIVVEPAPQNQSSFVMKAFVSPLDGHT
eukprot:ANDGO_01201.mRNA.1 hypothetical protein